MSLRGHRLAHVDGRPASGSVSRDTARCILILTLRGEAKGELLTRRTYESRLRAAFLLHAPDDNPLCPRVGVGYAAVDLGTGQVQGYRGDERFPMLSTFKVLVCGAILARVDARKERLDGRVFSR